MSCAMCPAETFQKAEFSRFLAVRSNTNMLCPVKYPNIPLNTTSRPDFSVAQVGMYARYMCIQALEQYYYIGWVAMTVLIFPETVI